MLNLDSLAVYIYIYIIFTVLARNSKYLTDKTMV